MSSTGEGSGPPGQGGWGGGSGGGSCGGRHKKKPNQPVEVILKETNDIDTAMAVIILIHGSEYGLTHQDYERGRSLDQWIFFIDNFRFGSHRPPDRHLGDDQRVNLIELGNHLRNHRSDFSKVRKSTEADAASTLLEMGTLRKRSLQEDAESKRQVLKKFNETQSRILSANSERPEKKRSIHVEQAAQSIFEHLQQDFNHQAIVSIIERLEELSGVRPDEHPYDPLKRPRPGDGGCGGGGAAAFGRV
jgi:hypothetical protein